jgi:hypothetical protein
MRTWEVLTVCQFNTLRTFIGYKKRVLGSYRVSSQQNRGKPALNTDQYFRKLTDADTKGFIDRLSTCLNCYQHQIMSKLTHRLLVMPCALCAVNNKGLNTYCLAEYPFHYLKTTRDVSLV